MDDAPYTEDLDLSSVVARDDLAALLRTVHLRADRPSLRVLEARTRLRPVPLSKTVVSEMLNGARFPRKAVMLAFLQACGVQDDHLEPWQRAWERIAVREQGAMPTEVRTGAKVQRVADFTESSELSDQVTELREENEKLRRQLAASSGGDAGSALPDDQSTEREAASPAVRRRELGVLLRELRLEHGMTVEQVAEHLLCSPGKVSRMESAFRSGTVRDVRDLCGLYGIPERQRDHLMLLARESKQQGWWQSYKQVHFEKYIGLESGAASMKVYESAIIPGLLQTEAYMRAMHHAGVPVISPERIEELIEVRLIRQRILTRPDPPSCWWIIDEAALCRPVGGPEVMRSQLEHMIELSGLPNVTLQIIPFAAGAHPAMGDKFVILEFAEPVPGIVYTEGLVGWTYIEQPSELRRYQRVLESLLTLALGVEDSIQFITKMIRSIQV